MQIGRYEVLRKVAAGGMGVVYQARDVHHGHLVALKLLKVLEPKARRRFAREAAALSRVFHPKVVPLLATGEHEDQPYLVLPLVQGDSLQEVLDGFGPLRVEQALAVGVQVARGLEAAHALGLIHRDVKPDNVILDPKGEGYAINVVLTDFGLVKALSPEASASASLSVKGRFLGTPGYWPREQAFGRLEQIGPPADVYGLGALLFALLTGDPPRQGRTLIEAIDAFDTPPPALRARCPHAPAWLEALVARCLDDDPARRPPLAEVRASLEHEGSPPPPPRRWVAPAAGALSSLAVLGAALALLWPQAAAPLEPPQAAAARASAGTRGLVDLGYARLEAGDPWQALALAARALELDPDSLDARGLRGHCWVGLGDPGRAEGDFRWAVELRPESVNGWLMLAQTLATQGREVEFREALGRVLALDPDHHEALKYRALLSSPDEARRDFKRLLELDPEGFDLYGALAVACRRAGDFAGAYEALDAGQARHPEDPDYAFERGLCFQREGRLVDALAEFGAAEALGYREVALLENRAQVLNGLRRFARAQEVAERALQANPRSAIAYAERGHARQGLGKFEASIRDFDRAEALDYFSPRYLLALRGKSLLEVGDDGHAAADLQRSLDLDPLQAEVAANLGYAYHRLERYADAVEVYTRALALEDGATWSDYLSRELEAARARQPPVRR